MSLLFLDSFDAGDFAAKWNVTGTSGASSVTTTPFGTGRAYQKAPNSNHAISRAFTPSPTVIVGFWFSYNTNYSGFPAEIMTVTGDNGTVRHIALATGDANNTLILSRGWVGTTLATATNIAYGWHWCEMKVTVADSGGTAEVRIDGVTVINYTGDTKNGGTSTNIDGIITIGSQNNTGITLLLKDLFVLNTSGSRLNDFLGPRRCATLVGTAPGSSTALTPSAGANWSCVDELPPSYSDTVTGVPGTKDTYDLADLPSWAASVEAVQVNIYGKRVDASPTSVKPVLRSGGTDYTPSTGAVAVADTTVSAVFETDPATAAVWTLAGVNAIQHGVEVA